MNEMRKYLNLMEAALQEAPASMPTDGTSASKARNYLIKVYGGEPLKSFGNSNPYSDSQSLECKFLDRNTAHQLIQDLQSQGWNVEKKSARDPKSTDVFFDIKHPDGGFITAWSTNGRSTFGKKAFVLFTVYGRKTAKRSNIPYYD